MALEKVWLAGGVALGLCLGAGTAHAQKIGVVVMCAHPKQQAQAGQLAAAISESLARSRDLFHWRDLVAAKSPSLGAEQSLRQRTQEALALVRSGDQNRAAVAEIAQAMKTASPTASVTDEQAAQVALGVVAWAQGDAPGAEQKLTEALAFEPALRAPEVTEPPGFAEAFERARFAVSDHARGELSVQSTPGGARVLVDGVYKGTAPLVVQGLAQGPHLVQLDLFGYALQGEIVRVAGAEAEYAARLGSSDLLAEADLRQAVTAAAVGENGKALAELVRPFDLAYLVVGWLATKGSADTLALAAVRIRDGRILAVQVLPLEGDEYGQAGARAASLANTLLEGKTGHTKAAGKKEDKAHDPLDQHDGTEDW